MNIITKRTAINKICNFCAYQERSPRETHEKLLSYGLNFAETEEILEYLIKENYINEKRFALQYAGAKFRLKHWGKFKISFALKQKGISDTYIKEALSLIDMDDYYAAIEKLARQKISSLAKEPLNAIKQKTTAYLLQKGYASTDIQEIIKTVLS